jgi:NAD+ kinase
MKKVKIAINEKKPGAGKILRRTRKVLEEKGFVFSEKPDFIVVVGGDGMMLSAAHRYGKKGLPVLGVNAGGLGFLTDVTLDQLADTLIEIKNKKFHFEKRMVIQARFARSTLYALNDLTIVTRVPGRAVEFSAIINKEYICRFIADGIIISTPTGSTAYSLATGGPILLPHTEAIIVTPIAPHTLSVRPIVLPSNSVVEVKVGRKGKAVLVADGQRAKSIKNGQTIKFKKAKYYVKLLKPLHTTFFKTLREKMKWGGREDA